MVSEKELKEMIARVQQFGGIVNVTYDGDYIDTVQFENVRGIGPYPCGAIGAAEAMRSALGKVGTVKYEKGRAVPYKFTKD